MKSCVRVELYLPSESILAWILEHFPELPSDTQIKSIYAGTGYGSPLTVKIIAEHSHVDTDAKEKTDDGS